ncbi:MAG TPA: NAD-dependent epimerase/dehydratase family protein [Chthoniobacterales bacterium]|nr:NAD-dependent epimerase/dehydratase family protein [Chthoniobacterales bacterium]
MKALVTGGAGFIGSHLAEALCRRGDSVVVVDDLSSGTLDNLAWRAPAGDLEFVQGDAGDDVLLGPLLKDCDCVFHLAAMPSVQQSIIAPLESNRRNLETTLRLFVAARDAGVRRVVFASSSSVYGDAKAGAQQEAAHPQLLSPYAIQKYAAEQYARLFHRLDALPVVTLRYFNVFGPRQAYDSPYAGVVARFCKAILNSRPITIYGDGQQSRDFTYIDNVISANLLAAAAPEEKIAGRIFDCATGTSVSVIELAAALAELTGGPLAQSLEPNRAGDIRDSRADISAIESELGYRVSVGWKEGLRRTLDSYRLDGATVSADARSPLEAGLQDGF